MTSFPITDNRAPRHGFRRTASGLYTAGPNFDSVVRKMRESGFTLPTSNTHARLQARRVISDVEAAASSRGTATDIANRAMMADMRRQRAGSSRLASGGGKGGFNTREAANVQMVLPKIRQPMSSLMDKGIPFNVQDPKELIELRRWCRLFAATHPLVPLLIDIYCTFPVQGLEFTSKDPAIEDFYSKMFMDDLNYDEFLPDALLKEYFTVGEVTAFAHFNEELGTWASEEILNPDYVRVSKSLFVEQERVQLLVKDMVEALRDAPTNPDEESPSERYERNWEYQMLVKHYPEIIQAAMQDDGLDISETLVSRLVDKAAWWDTRGTPRMLRSFRTLMMEESLHAAEDAVCLVAGTPILTDCGVSRVEDVKVGDRVLTHRGRYRTVRRTMKRDADESGVTMRWWYDQPMTLTGEHPVYVRRPINMPSHHYDGQRHTEWAEGFIPAREVCVYDQVLHPYSPDSGKEYVSIWEHLDQSDWVTYDPTDIAHGMTGHDWYDTAATQTQRVSRKRIARMLEGRSAQTGDIVRPSRFGSKAAHFSAEYKLTEDLLWLIGLHVADGSACVRDHGTGTVVIALADHEVELQQRAMSVIREVFGLESLLRPDYDGKKCTNVIVNSLPFATWLREMCGVREAKRFPSWAFGLNSEQTAALVQGWMDGDGTTDDVRTLGSSAYRNLQESAAWLMRRAGVVTSSRRAPRGRSGYDGSGCQYTVTTVKTPRRAYQAEQGGYWVEVRSVEHHQLTQAVYNLEVEEDNSYCAPIAVHNCDRMYAPLLLATLGIENMGDGEPWIPDAGELEDLRDDIQAALAADLKVLVHNMGLQVTSVLGRESVPRFDTDYDRVDTQLMQSWGIGPGMIQGGSGAGGAYATSAINREVVELLMKKAQNKVKRHLKGRMEIIAEAQEHYDYDLKGGVRVPIYEHIEEYNEETGEKEIVRVPKLLIPEPEFATLNIRDEATERQFMSTLKELGVPISDGKLAMGVEIDFEQQLEVQAAETYAKGMAQAQVMDKLQKKLDADGLPYPAELVQFLQATLTIRGQLAQTEMMESQNKMADQQLAQSSPAGLLGLLPGTTMQPLSGAGIGGQPMGADPTSAGLPPSQGGDPSQASEAAPGATADPTLGAGAPAAADPSAAQGDPSAMQLAASLNGHAPAGFWAAAYMRMHGPGIRTATMSGPNAHPPVMAPPGGIAEPEKGDKPRYVEPPRNRTRPEESDEMRAGMPKTSAKYPVIDRIGEQVFDGVDHEGHPIPRMAERDLTYAERGPSSYGHRLRVSKDEVVEAINRRHAVQKAAEAPGGPRVEDLVHDPHFWATVGMGRYQGEVEADFEEIRHGGAPEAADILKDALEHYEDITGIEARW